MNQYNDLKETFFKGVYRFPAGHWFEYKDGKMKNHQYWDAKYVENSLSFEETLDKINEDLKETVDLYRNADVPVGAFLSEGIDSSYLTSLLDPEDVFSVSFDDSTYNEASKAKALSDLHGWKFLQIKLMQMKQCVTSQKCNITWTNQMPTHLLFHYGTCVN